MVTISGSNLGQKADDILESVTVAGVACTVIPQLYEISSRYCPEEGWGGYVGGMGEVCMCVWTSHCEQECIDLILSSRNTVTLTEGLVALVEIGRAHV